MKRFDGSLDFGRTWEDYANGFGDINNEFWMGNFTFYTLYNYK